MVNPVLQSARQVLSIEADALNRLRDHLDERFVAAHDAILACEGRVVVSGIGKSGHVGHKMASTLASTGTPAFFLHPAEARHGDLGMIQPDDLVIAISYSGETEELLAIAPLLKRRGSTLIAMTGNENSSLAQLADIHLNIKVEREACPHNLAPTASSTATLALGDALAVSLLSSRGFSADDFASTHPGGNLGKRLLTRVADVMHVGEAIPKVKPTASVSEALKEMSRAGLGVTCIVNEANELLGIFTDGDLRRALERGIGDAKTAEIQSLMTSSPTTISAEKAAVEAAELMQTRRISAIAVVDERGSVVGVFNMHDLMRAGIV